MLKNNKFNIFLAIIIAIALWAYVLGDVNPTTSVTVKDIPIEFINQDTLEYSNKVVLDCSDDTINITVTGPRTEATKVKQSDFKVVADVEALKLGSNVVRLSVKGPDNVEITNISTDKITINVDKLIAVNKEIKVVTSGNLEDDMEAYVVDVAKDTIKVSGAKSLVNRVDRVNAVVDATKIDNSMKTVQATLEAVDADGKIVEGVNLSSSYVNVTVVMHHKKTVNLEVPVENADATDFERSISVPKTIVIKGEDELLSAISTVKCEAIDLSLYKETTTVELKPILPEGVQISSDSSNLYAEITVKELSKATIRISEDDIKLVNISAELKYKVVAENMTMVARGKESDLIGIDVSDFTITADVKDLEKGTHKVKVKIESKKNIISIEPSTDEITIVIE